MFDRDEQEISQTIESGLEAIQSGKITLEEFAAQHPDEAIVLRTELEAATWLMSRQEHIAPRPGFVHASRRRVVDRIKQEASSTSRKHAFFGFAWPRRIAYQWVAAIIIVIFLFSGTGGLVTFAQGSLPGDGMYAIKRISEDVSYFITPGEIGRAELNVRFTNRRLDEITSLVARGKLNEVPLAVQQYEQQVSRSVAQLNDIPDSQAQKKEEIAGALKNTLSSQAESLNVLSSVVPADVAGPLHAAQQSTEQGAASAGKVIEHVKKDEATLTPTGTATGTSTSTDVPTVDASQTPEPVGAQDPDTVLEQPTGTAEATITPGETGKKVKTPKPDNGNNNNSNNNNQPPKPDTGKPTPKPKDNNSNPPNNNPNPPNNKPDPKPTKDNNPPGKNK